MMTYTETGLSLIADAVASGKQVKITRIELIADPERSEGELTHNAEIASVEKYNNTTIDIKVVTDNYNFKKDYFFNRVNVYATGADGQEVLFCFQHTKTCPIYIPAYDGRTIQNEIKIRLNVTSADVVDIVNDGVYVLRTDFEKELAKKINIADIVQDADKGEADKVISAAVAKTLQDQIDQKIDIKNIVQNTVTAATDKVVSAAVAKALQDQITELNTNTIRKKSGSPVCQIGTDQYFNAVSMYDQNGAWKNYLLSQKNDAKMFVAQYQITPRGDGKHELHFYDADGGWICKFTSD